MTRPKIALIGCGGTISTMATGPLDFIDYPETGRKMETPELVAQLGDLASFVELEPVAFRAVGSSAIGPAEWLELAAMIDAMARTRPDIAAVVIPHGTATLEETAYFLHLALRTDLPVVLVGAQRPFNAAGSDAQVNLVSALRAATDPRARGCGVMVVLNDEIHSARHVTKTSTYRLQAFRSPDFGPIGVVDADRVVFHARPLREHTLATPFSVGDAASLPRVDIAYAHAGSDGAAIAAFRTAGAKGIVSAGFAPGMPTPAERDLLAEAARDGIVVVQASRAGSGRVARRQSLVRAGWVGAGDLNPHKARVLLMLSLTLTRSPDEIQAFFDRF